MTFQDEQGREVEVEIEFNGDGSAYYSDAVYMDDESKCSDEVLDYLESEYADYLFEIAQDRYRDLRASMFYEER